MQPFGHSAPPTDRDTNRPVERSVGGDEYTRSVGSGAAFFDLDRTVIATSSALAFARPFYRDGLLNRRDVVASGYAQAVYKLAGAGDEQMARIRDQLATMSRGWPVDQVRRIVAGTIDELIAPYVYAEALVLIEQHRAAGRDIVLVSSSGEEMVRPIARLVGADDVIATRMAIRDGRFTGEVDFYAAGESKAVAVRELATRNGYDLATCYAYSDSVSDVPLLSTVGYPTVVNADRGLRRVARAREWPVLTFRNPVPTPLTRIRYVLSRPPGGPLVPMAVLVTASAAVTAAVWYARRRRPAARALPAPPPGP